MDRGGMVVGLAALVFVAVAFIVAAVGFARRRRNKNAKPGSGGRPGTGSPGQQEK